MARFEVADRSMPATISTKVWPIATISSGIIAPRMSRQVSTATISGASGIITTT